MNLKQLIERLFAHGLHPLPIQRTVGAKREFKTPEWQEDIGGKAVHDLGDALRWLRNGLTHANGLAIRLDPPVFMLDFDSDNWNKPGLFEAFREEVELVLGEEVFSKCCLESTKSGGYHLYARYPAAQRWKGLAKNHQRQELIGVYAQGALSWAWPTPGYEILEGSLETLVDLTSEEYEWLIRSAKIFDETEVKPSEPEVDGLLNLPGQVDQAWFEETLAKVIESGVFQPESYNDWLKTGFALAHQFGEAGREYFYRLSEGTTTWDQAECDKLFDDALRRQPGRVVKIGTLFWLWEQAGYKVQPVARKARSSLQYSGFWTNDRKKLEVQLSTGLLLDHLVDEGFRILDSGYVQVKGGVIYERAKAWLYNYIIELVSKEPVEFKVVQKQTQLTFTLDQETLKTKAQKELKGNLQILALPVLDEPLFRDTAQEIFFHFQDVSLTVTADRITFFHRTDDQLIYEKQVIGRGLGSDDGKTSQFELFVQNISGENLRAFETAIGYLCRNYNGSDGMRAAWLYDEDFEVGKTQGRTGKSLFGKAIGQVRKRDECSGKDLRETSQFKFQNMSRDTQVYVIEDVKEGFNFEAFYSMCTEGMEFEAKNRPRVKLSVQETPKVIITDNRPPRIDRGSSMLGRLYILPVKNYYVQYTQVGGVKYVHQQVFFDDWDEAEWSRFYWYMARCCQQFLAEGFVETDMRLTRLNSLKATIEKKLDSGEMAQELAEWLFQAELPRKFTLEALMKKFVTETGVDGFGLDGQVFAACLKSYLDLTEQRYVKDRKRGHEGQKITWILT